MQGNINKVEIEFVFKDGESLFRTIAVENNRMLLSRSEIPVGTDQVKILSREFVAEVGDAGYFIIPNARDMDKTGNNDNAALVYFRKREDTESAFIETVMPIYAVSRNNQAILAVVSGMPLEYKLVCGVKRDRYYLYPCFILDGEKAYEDIEINFFMLQGNDTDYSGIARRYRHYQLERNACLPLKERSKKFPALAEAAMGPEIRVRMGWKPVPPPVLEQTEENEPPMHAAITFERGEDIVEEFHRNGIEHAEFCLVGWNKSGHDGRFPDIFPVEPLLGGEDGLKKLIKKARGYGYLICGHTNLLDSYTIAKRWKAENVLYDKNGEMHKGGCWGG